MAGQPSCPITTLPVRARRVHEPAGEVEGQLFVTCPDEGGAVEVERCLACRWWAGLYLDATEASSFVQCGWRDEGRDDAPLAAPEEDTWYPPLGRTRIGELMSRKVECVSPDTPADEVARLLDERCFGGVPVVDGSGKPLGVVSKSDVVHALYEDGLAGKVAADLMTPFVFALPASAPVSRAAWLMAYEGVHRVVALSHDRKVVGVLTPLDVLRWLSSGG